MKFLEKSKLLFNEVKFYNINSTRLICPIIEETSQSK